MNAKFSGIFYVQKQSFTLTQVFYCVFCDIFKNTFYTQHLWWLLVYIEVIIYLLFFNLHGCTFNTIYDGPLSRLLMDRGSKKAPPHPKICHIFSYNNETWHNYTLLKEFQKMYKSHDRLLEFC